MANISGSNDFPWLGLIIIVLVVCGVGWVINSSIHEVSTGDVTPQRSDAERLGLTVVCLNGVQYWKDDDGDMRSEALAPKYSAGYHYPDICEGHGEKQSSLPHTREPMAEFKALSRYAIPNAVIIHSVGESE